MTWSDLDPAIAARAMADWGEQSPLDPLPGYFPEAPEEWLARHNRFCARAAAGGMRVLFLGDSITEGWLAPENAETWEETFGKLPADNFGIGGDRTQQLLWRIDHGTLKGLDPDLVVLKIGVNNVWSLRHTAEEIAAGVQAVIGRIQTHLPRARILNQAILPTAQNPDDPYRVLVRAINPLLQRAADGDRVRFVDFGHLFLEPDDTISPEVMPDFCHLSPTAYRAWAEALIIPVRELLA